MAYDGLNGRYVVKRGKRINLTYCGLFTATVLPFRIIQYTVQT